MISAFLAFIFLLVIIDLLSTRKMEITFKSSLIISIIWIALAIAFGVLVHYLKGSKHCIDYYAAYLTEKSLSIDNLFVFYLIFSDFKMNLKQQHKLLFYGIIGAILMRGFFIYFGIELIHNFEWVIYIFGAILIWSGLKIVIKKESEENKLKDHVVHFMERFNLGKWSVFLPVLIIVELSDLMFAVDSVPAVLAISNDVFVAYTSNVWAILGLRALYFLIASIISRIYYLKQGLCIILVFVGIKMLLSNFYEISSILSLGVILLTILLSFLVSYAREKKNIPTI